MGGATFPRAHTWVDNEDLTAAALNAEFDNILNNGNPAGWDGYEDNATQMKLQTSPGGFGTESLATSLAGEIERIRYVISRIIGGTNGVWYDTPALSLSGAQTLFNSGVAIPANRIASGRVDANNQAMALVPDGSTNTVKLKAATTNLSYYIQNTNYVASSDVSLASLTLAPSSNNTALVNDTTLAAAAYTKMQGEYGSTITMDSVGTNISNLVGQYAAFKVVHGGNTEYFTAYVASSTTLTKASRGIFFNSADANQGRIAIADDDTITLLKATWIFVNTSGQLAATYNQPKYSNTAPTSPAAGDYWYDMTNQVWKVYSSGSFTVAAATLLGMCVQDTTKTVVARTFEYYAAWNRTQTVQLELSSTTVVQGNALGQRVSVAGAMQSFDNSLPQWTSSGQFASGVSLTINTPYFAYVNASGQLILDIVHPADRRADLLGYYHPAAPWRCVGFFVTDGSSNFTTPQGYGINDVPEAAVGTTQDFFGTTVPPNWLAATGATVSRLAYFRLFTQIGIACGYGDNSTTFQLPDTRGYFSRGWNNGAGIDPDAAGRSAMNPGGNTGDNVGTTQTDAFKAHTHVVNYGSGSGGTSIAGDGSGSANNENTGSTGGNETRPLNYYVYRLIKP